MRSRGTGCPYCAGQKVSIDNCLHSVNPTLAGEWHPTTNGPLTPKDVTRASTKKVWWLCSEGHEWEAQVSWRSRGNKCPYCSGRAVGSDNFLGIIYAELARQWHPERNGNLSPKDVTPYSTRKVWWICERGHEWQAVIYNRSRGRGCPYCSGKAVCEDNSLYASNPSLAAEWHPEKNGSLTPKDVTPSSNKRVWWQCEKGHQWQAYVHSRSRGYGGCSYCSGKRKA
jgi:hypothetical protein